MHHLGLPEDKIWRARQDWFWSIYDRHFKSAGYVVGEQASALTAELEAVFCVGAWCTVVILSYSIVEAQLREAELDASRQGRKLIRDVIDDDPELTWLRMTRNSLVHANPDKPQVTVDDLWSKADEYERNARRAVELVFRTLFLSPWI